MINNYTLTHRNTQVTDNTKISAPLHSYITATFYTTTTTTTTTSKYDDEAAGVTMRDEG